MNRHRRSRSWSLLNRRPRHRGLKNWNFWTPIHGTLYGFDVHHPRTGRLVYGYGGKTMQVPWTKRAEAHLWGSWDRPPKPWADTVPGYRPNGTIEEVANAGGVRVLWQARTVPLVLTWMEILYAIKLRRPLYNDQWNRGNSRRITKADQEQQRRRRNRRGRFVPDRGLCDTVGAVLTVAGLLLLIAVVAL